MTGEEFKSSAPTLRGELVGVAMRYVDADSVNDIAQDTLLRLWEMRQTLRHDIGAFAKVVAKNLAVDALRRRRPIVKLEMAAALPAHAQNSIDRLVDEFSTVGSSKFTSVVQRNPKTRAVEKVVKKLSIHGVKTNEIIKAFNKEAKHHNLSTQVSEGWATKVFVESGKHTNRAYMIKYNEGVRFPDAEITIVIKVK